MPRITVDLTPTSADLFAASIDDEDDPGERLATAIAFYLAGRSAEIGGWPYPAFRQEDGLERAVRFEIDVDDGVWASFAAEAERQGVSVEQLFEHAALYLAAAHDVSSDGDGR